MSLYVQHGFTFLHSYMAIARYENFILPALIPLGNLAPFCLLLSTVYHVDK